MDFGKKVVILCFEFSPYRFTKTNYTEQIN